MVKVVFLVDVWGVWNGGIRGPNGLFFCGDWRSLGVWVRKVSGVICFFGE